MSVRVFLDIGHEASVRTKRTPEGFTHDWEVFVKGYDGAEIQYFVEKVVFYLHETFPKPKRVIKEPPYSVKESGYAGFNLPIEIYLRNKDEPKKLRFNYDLNLQPLQRPLLTNVQREKCVFNQPNDDFKHKLLKGGGSIVNSQEVQEPTRSSTDVKNELINKPKLGGSDLMKKHKVRPEEPRISNSFQDLFGTPITKTTKITTDSKTISKDVNKNSSNKNEKDKEKVKDKSKYSPNKEKDREKSKEKSTDVDRKKDEKKSKDRNRDREHSKEKNSKRDRSPRPTSPSPKHSPKRISSPKRPPSPPPLPVKQHKDDKRFDPSKDKKTTEDKKSKKRDKEPKHKDKEPQKLNDYKEQKPKEPIKDQIERKPKDVPKELPKETIEQPEKIDRKPEEKQKHKHKKKDKDRKDKDKTQKVVKTPTKPPEPIKEIRDEKPNLFSSPKLEEKPKKPSLFSEVENDTSNSSLSSREDPFVEPANLSQSIEPKKPKVEDKPKRERKKNKDKKGEKDEKKRKRKSEKVDDEPMEKIPKEETTNSKLESSDSEQNSNPSQQPTEIDKENQENPEDYMQILRDLQHKIMTLQDNTELQKVVQLIAKTGRYEVSARTFDFDLCLLEKSTVRQLQEFFASSS